MSKMPRSLKLVWGVVLAFLVSLSFTSVYLFWQNLQDHCHGPWEHTGVRVALHSPEYLSVGEAEEVEVTVLNEGDRATRVSVVVEYTGTAPCLTESDRSHAVRFRSLLPHERATGRLRVRLPHCLNHYSPPLHWFHLGLEVRLRVWLIVDNQPPEPLDTVSLLAMPIPSGRTLGKALGTFWGGLVLWVGKEVYSLVKAQGHATPASED